MGYNFPSLKDNYDSNILYENHSMKKSTIDMFVNKAIIKTSYQLSKEFLAKQKAFSCQNKEYNLTFGNSDLHSGCRSYLASVIRLFKT